MRKGESWIRFYFLRCTVHQTESCWKYKSSDSFFFAYTYCRYIVFSSTITYLVVHKYTYNASRPHKSTIRLRFTWHLPLDIDIWEELYITKYVRWWDLWLCLLLFCLLFVLNHILNWPIQNTFCWSLWIALCCKIYYFLSITISWILFSSWDIY